MRQSSSSVDGVPLSSYSPPLSIPSISTSSLSVANSVAFNHLPTNPTNTNNHSYANPSTTVSNNYTIPTKRSASYPANLQPPALASSAAPNHFTRTQNSPTPLLQQHHHAHQQQHHQQQQHQQQYANSASAVQQPPSSSAKTHFSSPYLQLHNQAHHLHHHHHHHHNYHRDNSSPANGSSEERQPFFVASDNDNDNDDVDGECEDDPLAPLTDTESEKATPILQPQSESSSPFYFGAHNTANVNATHLNANSIPSVIPSQSSSGHIHSQSHSSQPSSLPMKSSAPYASSATSLPSSTSSSLSSVPIMSASDQQQAAYSYSLSKKDDTYRAPHHHHHHHHHLHHPTTINISLQGVKKSHQPISFVTRQLTKLKAATHHVQVRVKRAMSTTGVGGVASASGLGSVGGGVGIGIGVGSMTSTPFDRLKHSTIRRWKEISPGLREKLLFLLSSLLGTGFFFILFEAFFRVTSYNLTLHQEQIFTLSYVAAYMISILCQSTYSRRREVDISSFDRKSIQRISFQFLAFTHVFVVLFSFCLFRPSDQHMLNRILIFRSAPYCSSLLHTYAVYSISLCILTTLGAVLIRIAHVNPRLIACFTLPGSGILNYFLLQRCLEGNSSMQPSAATTGIGGAGIHIASIGGGGTGASAGGSSNIGLSVTDHWDPTKTLSPTMSLMIPHGSTSLQSFSDSNNTGSIANSNSIQGQTGNNIGMGGVGTNIATSTNPSPYPGRRYTMSSGM